MKTIQTVVLAIGKDGFGSTGAVFLRAIGTSRNSWDKRKENGKQKLTK